MTRKRKSGTDNRYTGRLVVKIGSSTLLTEKNQPDEAFILHVAEQVKALKDDGWEVALVVSGAVALGATHVTFKEHDWELKSMAAGIGQIRLAAAFEKGFASQGMLIGQILLRPDDLNDWSNHCRFLQVIPLYLRQGVVPFINENDATGYVNDFGGNDYLAVKIAALISAERSLILSSTKKSSHGVGGGESKREAIGMFRGHASIVNGRTRNVIIDNVR